MTTNNTNSGLEPRIIKGHKFMCKKSVQMYVIRDNGTRKATDMEAYTKGKVYECEVETPYPGTRYSGGCITDNQGDKGHGWSYDPAHHPWAGERRTDFFEDLGEA